MLVTLRTILSVLVGGIAAMLVTTGMEMAGHAWSPRPDLRIGLLLVMAAHALGCLAGALLAGWLARPRGSRAALVVVGVMLAGAVANLAALPHPRWFALADPLAISLAGALALRLLNKRRS